ncbi:50S ribosomal protein L28 [Helcococcus kunzii]|uniref:Large ribosomal subunit protein bL28 n=1 Tax=Helcococcus kunzii ATCC 51366 TaxID=883114 RepID=H3NNI2_9FIRM|nr:50S ribosomal protein L28 [Helcococcus kunzii]EHR33957.1 ribosomal protein L28 [Helcococcus kunzii ATCC 51366]MCT1795565.1 50S ribosomal protein L28 [Helcococcus kunzii]MCT1989327.1 50S ribosomal protein L28 [Helcococcus kunzii]QUY64808.1 50S ribosomal protein L28 [Helcococcus kunzii]QZO77249.1 50S ribosomal protein L28 [Helcococcus kunzii]
MARQCAITGKKKKSGNIVTFSHRKIKRSFKPNLRRVKAVVDGKVQTIWVSTKALKSGLVERPSYGKTADAE